MPAPFTVEPPDHSATAAVARTDVRTEPGRVFWVLERNLAELQRRIERLARRAQRLGTGPLALHDAGRRARARAAVVLDGAPPALAGWTLAAIVEHRDSGAVLELINRPPVALDARRFAAPRCDHCRLRRRRTETFVVWHAETRRLRQVGSGCLRDLLAGHDPERLCRQAEYHLLAQRELRSAAAPRAPGAVSEPGVVLAEFAAHAAHILRNHGWISRRHARETGQTASADAALRSLRATPDTPDAADRALGSAALRWARELLPRREHLTDFEGDAVAVTALERLLTARERGLACALIAVYRQRRARSRHLGTPGHPLDTAVLVERVVETRTRRHALVRRHDLIDADGNRLVWWQTSGPALPVGLAIRIHARVARHTRFGRANVTVLTHCHRVDGS